eukprot:Hpha_TRINITY_DN22930_c0_g1::TRINITY_DN22930_c0_g1_i1::g.153958::m.153958/K15272/SLC35A1_2_3; solute carrier family 35 (UDP-sugar transporter), member A1/2/3
MLKLSTTELGYLVCGLGFSALTAPMIKFTQDEGGGYSYNKWCVFLFAEVLKLSASGCWCLLKWYNDEEIRNKMVVDRRDVVQYALPAFVFFLQNNLSFAALQHMSSAAFLLLLHLRIAAVGVMSLIVLGKPLNRLEWVGIFLLTNGAAQFLLAGTTRGGDATNPTADLTGLLIMACIIGCTGGGHIATQLVVQRKNDQPRVLQNTMLYAWGVVMNAINWAASVWGLHSSKPEPWLGDFNRMELLCVLFYAAYGMSFSSIMRRFGAVARTPISCGAILLAALIDHSYFRVSLSALQATSFITIFVSVFIYSILAPDRVVEEFSEEFGTRGDAKLHRSFVIATLVALWGFGQLSLWHMWVDSSR